MYAEERQHEIVTRAREMGRVAVAELAARYDVTAETIRRDLDALAAKGLLSRVYGGAVPAEKLRLTEAPMPARQVAATTEKQASCDVETGHFIQVLAAVTRAAVSIITIAPSGVRSWSRTMPVPTVETTCELSKVAPISTKTAISTVARVRLLMSPLP